MLENLKNIAAGIDLGGAQELFRQFEGLVREYLGSVPMPLVYMVLLGIGVVLAYTIARVLVRLALYVAVPTALSTMIVPIVYPSASAGQVAPLAAVVFLAIHLIRK